jgi:PAS domain
VSSPPSRRSFSALPAPVLRYGLSAVSVGAAVLLMLGLDRLAGAYDARPALLLAVAVSALCGGIGPGLVALALGTLVVRDPIVLLTGILLTLICARFGRPLGSRQKAAEPDELSSLPRHPPVPRRAPGRVSESQDGQASAAPRLEVTTEATWRFHHEQPLDITLPEDEQVEHLYLYSVLAECNDAFARMYGFRSAGDVVGTRLVVFLPPSNPENVAYLRTFIRSGYRLEDAESHEIDRYGHAKYFVNNLVGIFERGHLVGAWGTQRDVTDQKKGAESPQEYSSRLHST